MRESAGGTRKRGCSVWQRLGAVRRGDRRAEWAGPDGIWERRGRGVWSTLPPTPGLTRLPARFGVLPEPALLSTELLADARRRSRRAGLGTKPNSVPSFTSRPTHQSLLNFCTPHTPHELFTSYSFSLLLFYSNYSYTLRAARNRKRSYSYADARVELEKVNPYVAEVLYL